MPRPWNIKVDESYRPRATIILPTYNEAKLIQSRLDNIYTQDYPKELIEVIVIDSSSNDGTPDLVKEWISRHRDFNLKLIEEAERRGKAQALNHALKHASGEIIVIADADALWPREALKETLKWFSDPTVGAVSCLKKPLGARVRDIEESYRYYYNTLRIAESKAYSTPIFHGELAAFRKDLLERLGGFPIDIGADDSHTATRIALMGYKAIIPENLFVEEIAPSKSYSQWRARRAQHLIQHFIKVLKELRRTPRELKAILLIEAYLHMLNPLLLFISVTLLATSALIARSPIAITALALGVALLILKPYRIWVTMQTYLLTATLKNLWSKEIVWNKQAKLLS
ncbi:MAG: glycosyltransferase [Sulfolobales archaeon]